MPGPTRKSLAERIAANQKKFGLRIGPLSQAMVDVEAITTGNIAIDWATGIGGIPRGRLTELYGPPASGKTTTALQAAAAAQKAGGTVAFADHEQALDPEYCAALGLDINAPSFLYFAPECLEDGVNIMKDLIDSGEVTIGIFDSVAAMVPRKELDGDTGDRLVAEQARLMAQACRQLVAVTKRTNTALIFLNHIQEVLDASPMGKKLAAAGVQRKSTPGGKALKFYASMRIEYKPVGGVREKVHNELTGEEEDRVTIGKTEIIVIKNKVGAPMRTAELRTLYGLGFSQAFNVVEILAANKLGIKKEQGGIYRWTDQTLAGPGMDVNSKSTNYIRGDVAMMRRIADDPEWLERLEKAARHFVDNLDRAEAIDDTVRSADSLAAEEPSDEDKADAPAPTTEELDNLLGS